MEYLKEARMRKTVFSLIGKKRRKRLLFLLPAIVERQFRVYLPDTMEIVILLFIFATEVLGEIQSYYTFVHGWDTIMHTLNGFLCAAWRFRTGTR